MKFILKIILLTCVLNMHAQKKTTKLIAYCETRGCSGSEYCSACKNCSGCKHCAKEGGICGVCSTPIKKKIVIKKKTLKR